MADPSPRPPAMTVRGLLPSSTGRALRATAPAIVVVSLLYAAQAGLTAVSPLMLQRIIDGAGPGASTSAIVIPGLLAAAAALADPKPKKKRRFLKVTGTLAILGGAAGAAVLLWKRSQPVEDPWAESYWEDVEVPTEDSDESESGKHKA